MGLTPSFNYLFTIRRKLDAMFPGVKITFADQAPRGYSSTERQVCDETVNEILGENQRCAALRVLTGKTNSGKRAIYISKSGRLPVARGDREPKRIRSEAWGESSIFSTRAPIRFALFRDRRFGGHLRDSLRRPLSKSLRLGPEKGRRAARAGALVARCIARHRSPFD